MKRIKLLVISCILGISLFASTNVFAKDGDIYNVTTNPMADKGSIGNIILQNKAALFDMLTHMENYGYEVTGELYTLVDVNNEFNKNTSQTVAQLQADVKANLTPLINVPSATLVGTFSAVFGQPSATVVLPNGVTVTSVTVDGTTLTSGTSYSVNGTTLSIVGAAATDTIQVTTSNGTVYTVINGASITISNIANITATVNQGDSYSLPSTVTATMSDGSTKNVAVTWNNQASTSQAGTYTFYGMVNGYNAVVILTLTVNASNTSPTGMPSNTSGSSNWAGYVVTPTSSSGYTSVSGSWTVPNVTANSQYALAAQWIGLGGVNSEDLLQMGTSEQIVNGQPTAAVWWEKLPDYAQNVISVPIGSTISVSIYNSAGSTWKLTFNVKAPTGQTQTQTITTTLDSSYAQGIGTSAEWISEDPTGSNNQLVPLANMGTINYSAAVANGEPLNAPGNNVQPVALTSSGSYVIVPSELGADGQSFSTTSSNSTFIANHILKSFTIKGKSIRNNK